MLFSVWPIGFQECPIDAAFYHNNTMSTCLSLLFRRAARFSSIAKFKTNLFYNSGTCFSISHNRRSERYKSSEGSGQIGIGLSWIIGVGIGASLWGFFHHNKLFIYSESHDALLTSNQSILKNEFELNYINNLL